MRGQVCSSMFPRAALGSCGKGKMKAWESMEYNGLPVWPVIAIFCCSQGNPQEDRHLSPHHSVFRPPWAMKRTWIPGLSSRFQRLYPSPGGGQEFGSEQVLGCGALCSCPYSDEGKCSFTALSFTLQDIIEIVSQGQKRVVFKRTKDGSSVASLSHLCSSWQTSRPTQFEEAPWIKKPKPKAMCVSTCQWSLYWDCGGRSLGSPRLAWAARGDKLSKNQSKTTKESTWFVLYLFFSVS